MYSLNGGNPGFLPMPEQHTSFLNTWTTQQAVSEASRRLTRYNGQQQQQQHSSTAMRVSKPSSANSSPRGSAGTSRRRTTVNDSQAPRRQYQHTPEQLSIPRQTINRAARPVSWHPTSHVYTSRPSMPPQQQPYYHLPTTQLYPDQQDLYQGFPHLSPVLGAYSSNTSPSSEFSPLPAVYPTTVPHYLSSDAWDMSHKQSTFVPSSNEYQRYSEAPPLTHTSRDETPAMDSQEWQPYRPSMGSTTPPTPDSMLYPQKDQPAISEAAVLDEAEEEGEILVGMGLYDTPEKYDEDPQLNNYRSAASSLFGTPFKREPMGRGLKLEETWEPPKSDDGEDDDDDENSD